MNKENEVKASTSILPNIPPLPFIFINNTECIVCKKRFKSSRGLFQHKSIIRKYNEIPARQKEIPNSLINNFKESIIYLIHRHLGKNSKNNGLQTVSVACPKDLFKVIFKNYIHYYTKKTGALKCVFRGPAGYQELACIFNYNNWGIKHHSQGQQTYIQMTPCCKENPLIKLRQKKAIKKNSRYSHGDVVIEWKQKKDIDDKENICYGGFAYIHFFVARKLFVKNYCHD